VALAVLPVVSFTILAWWPFLLLAVAAPVYILVAFRPAAALPSLSDAQRARAAAKRQQPVLEAGGPHGWQ